MMRQAKINSSWISFAIFILRGASIIFVLVLPLVEGDAWRFFSYQMVAAAYLALSFDLAYSYGKVLSFMQGSFFGVGAYAAIYFASAAPEGLVLTLCAAIACGAACGALIGAVLVRMGGHNMTIATVILAAIGLLVGNALSNYSGGEDGLQLATQTVGLGPLQLHVGANLAMYYSAALPLMALIVLSWAMQKRRVWKILRAVASNEARAEQLGFNVRLRRLVVFTVAAGIAALGGAYYVLLMQHVTTHVFDIEMSVNAILWAVVGGLGTAFGSLVGVLLVYPITDLIASVFVYVQILVGLLLIVVAVFFPGGLIGTLRDMAREGSELPTVDHMPGLEEELDTSIGPGQSLTKAKVGH
jgi:branched-chain amino acid transport system permease protein